MPPRYRDQILTLIQTRGPSTGDDLAPHLGIGPDGKHSLSTVLLNMRKDNLLVPVGNRGKSVIYDLPQGHNAAELPPVAAGGRVPPPAGDNRQTQAPPVPPPNFETEPETNKGIELKIPTSSGDLTLSIPKGAKRADIRTMINILEAFSRDLAA